MAMNLYRLMRGEELPLRSCILSALSVFATTAEGCQPVGEMGVDVYATVFASVIASIIGGATAIAVGYFTTRHQKRSELLAHVDRIVDLAIEYPYLEDDKFCHEYVYDRRDEEAMRYDNYCCQVFNLLERIWIFAGGNEKKMKDIIYYQEMICRHRTWWLSEPGNRHGYNPKFCQLVKQIIQECEEHHGTHS